MKFLPFLRQALTRAKAAASPASRLAPDLARIIRPTAALRWLTPSLAHITPTYIENVLRGGLAGDPLQQWELFDLMEDTWPRLAKNLNEVKRAVVKMDWKLQPWAEEDQPPTDTAAERARLISAALWKMRPAPDRADNAFEGTVYDILDALGKGTSVLEIEWQSHEAGITPRSTAWVHPMNYAWSPEGSLGLRVSEKGHPVPGSSVFSRPEIEPFPENKFLIAIARHKSGHPFGGALLRPLAWWWCAANFGAEWTLNHAQLFGQPIRWVNYDPSRPDLLTEICDMLENMGSSGWAAFPAGTHLELKEAAKAGGDDPQARLLALADKNCDLLVLGQTLTSDTGDHGSGSRALGEVHQKVREDVIQAAADFAAGVINQQFIPAILNLNYGDDSEAPEMCPEPRQHEDAKANAERDEILLRGGNVTLPKKWFYKRHNIPLPQDGEEVISRRGDGPSPEPERGCVGVAGPAAATSNFMSAIGEGTSRPQPQRARHSEMAAADAPTPHTAALREDSASERSQP